MQTVHDQKTLYELLAAFRANGESIALVPTMGALHAGHMALIELAKRHATKIVGSIFVNPKQFGPNEDFESYPRALEADKEKVSAAGVDVLWVPTPATMYPPGFATNVSVGGLTEVLCGKARPGHFDGVATVVTKLFTQIRPDVAVFGEKDWQQLAVIRQLTTDLNLGVKIIGAPIVREADGLAMSSRNAYLTAMERQIAAHLPRILNEAIAEIGTGASVSESVQRATSALVEAGFDTVDYLHIIAPDTLDILDTYRPSARIVAAARLGKTRLIDNMPLLI